MSNPESSNHFNPDEKRVTAFIKERERYVYLYRDDQLRQLVKEIEKDMLDPELSLTEEDFLVLVEPILKDVFPMKIKEALRNPRVAIERVMLWAQIED